MTSGSKNYEITEETNSNISEMEEDEEIRKLRRARRREQMRREKEKREKINRLVRICGIPAAGVLCIALIIGAVVKTAKGSDNGDTAEKADIVILNDNASDMDDLSSENISLNYSDINNDDLKFLTNTESLSVENEENEKNEESAATAMPFVAPAAVNGKIQVGDVEFKEGTEATATSLTKYDVTSEVKSNHAILINESDNTIVAQKDAMTKIYPASMTKVLTVLVAAEHVTNLDDEFTITIDITDYSYSNDCSAVGFLNDETVTVRDLFYGTILPSGGDAALGLATYVAGSQEAFVELMNEKLEELGIADTAHFTNCIGLYNEDHYCTTYDMAVIMKAAVENELCREVLSAHIYTTSSTTQHPDGITISNWFLRRIEDKDSGGLVMCGKTGFVNQSGSCAVSYYISDSGVPYICVTADTYSSWRCLYDHVAMYNAYAE
jgi:D-alanyl-D-alanine carboxypeptidase (penicillin-binding protein 5/6)